MSTCQAKGLKVCKTQGLTQILMLPKQVKYYLKIFNFIDYLFINFFEFSMIIWYLKIVMLWIFTINDKVWLSNQVFKSSNYIFNQNSHKKLQIQTKFQLQNKF